MLINTCVVCVFAAGYYGQAAGAEGIGLENAGAYLGRTFGSGIVVIWVRHGGGVEWGYREAGGVVRACARSCTPARAHGCHRRVSTRTGAGPARRGAVLDDDGLLHGAVCDGGLPGLEGADDDNTRLRFMWHILNT